MHCDLKKPSTTPWSGSMATPSLTMCASPIATLTSTERNYAYSLLKSSPRLKFQIFNAFRILPIQPKAKPNFPQVISAPKLPVQNSNSQNQVQRATLHDSY
jgi:hypothetical protein